MSDSTPSECPECRKAWDLAKAEWDAGGSPQSPPADRSKLIARAVEAP